MNGKACLCLCNISVLLAGLVRPDAALAHPLFVRSLNLHDVSKVAQFTSSKIRTTLFTHHALHSPTTIQSDLSTSGKIIGGNHTIPAVTPDASNLANAKQEYKEAIYLLIRFRNAPNKAQPVVPHPLKELLLSLHLTRKAQ